MIAKDQWLDWAVEIQSLAQAGLAYGQNPFDIERYTRLRAIAAEMVAAQTDLPLEKVQEQNGTWALPGGWCDVNQSVGGNAVKETLEEAGLHVAADRLIAVQDRDRHNTPRYAYGIVKVFIRCAVTGGGTFAPNAETTACRFFGRDELPSPLAVEKNTREQILMCFDANESPDWVVPFD